MWAKHRIWGVFAWNNRLGWKAALVGVRLHAGGNGIDGKPEMHGVGLPCEAKSTREPSGLVSYRTASRHSSRRLQDYYFGGPRETLAQKEVLKS
jgi:hypothetical protein